MTHLADVAAASADVGATSSRLAKAERLAEVLRGADPDDVATVVVAWLSGELPQRQIGVGWAALRSLPAPSDHPVLSVAEVHRTFSEIGATSGAGSQARRAELLAGVFGAATGDEQLFLRRLLGGELRQGALLGVMTDAIARAAAVPVAEVRRAAMLRGDLPAVAHAALTGGVAALGRFRLEVGRPVGPMLAQTATSVDDALTRLGGEAALEAKLDGARVQIHRDGDDVSICTRSLDDITARLPEVVGRRACAAGTRDRRRRRGDRAASGRPPAPLPGHRVALRHPHRAARISCRSRRSCSTCCTLDGDDLLDAPTSERLAVLDRIVPAEQRVDRLVTADPQQAKEFLDRTLAAGHEGVMAKSLAAPYEAGRRGAGWLKVKPVHTLDLVVLAVEWGSGRRRGKLSNIHLGARDPATGGFVMLGKTFKGMTDAMLDWQTERFRQLAAGPTDGYVVQVRPEQVVEIAFDGIQGSTRYPGGMALRFARVLRYRDDKSADEADTIDTVRAMHVG